MSVVYFLRQRGSLGPVKIGFTASPARRLKAIEAWSPIPLEIIAELPGGYALEHRLQNYFASDHSHSEWFRWSPRMAALLETIGAGTFDPVILPNCLAHVGGKRRGNPNWLKLESPNEQAAA